jgi:aquaporin NIP
LNTTLLRRIGAELIGTYFLVTAGCGAIMVNAQTGALGHLGVALTFGLAVVAMVASIGHISGAHFNPAVTIAFAFTRHFPRREVGGYIAGQLLGAVLGAITLRLLIGDVAYLGATLPTGSVGQAFGTEVLLTAVLMFVIVSVATDTRAVGTPAAITIGFTVTFNAVWGGLISGASMNPARSFAPALVAGVWVDQWVYWTAPIIGAVIGAVLYQWIRGEKG